MAVIACKTSEDLGYDGVVTGNAANAKLLKHYIETFEAQPIRFTHPLQFVINEKQAKKIMEDYNFDWTNDKR